MHLLDVLTYNVFILRIKTVKLIKMHFLKQIIKMKWKFQIFTKICVFNKIMKRKRVIVKGVTIMTNKMKRKKTVLL